MYGARQEVVLFEAVGVQVTSSRFVVGHQTYPIANITSVMPFTTHPSKGGSVFGIIFGIGALVLGLGTCGAGMAGESPGAMTVGFLFLLFGAGIIGLAIFIMRGKRPTHGVMISTSGMQVRALMSMDLSLVNNVLGALNQALSMR